MPATSQSSASRRKPNFHSDTAANLTCPQSNKHQTMTGSVTRSFDTGNVIGPTVAESELTVLEVDQSHKHDAWPTANTDTL